jgi:sugar lactone lactonase YvrE
VTADRAIAVSEPSARRVRFFDPDGRQLGEIATGTRLPLGLAADGDRLYVADPGAALLLVFRLGPP